jgi:2,4-dienoyl-CoA reductase-like NADH-dependent reductase (Old Yellow Enzyme family)
MSVLFTPKSIGKVTIKNRFVRSPTGDKSATADGKCTDSLILFYRQLADGGAGLLTTGASFVQLNGQLSPGFIGLHSDDVIEGYLELTKAVHAYPGVKIFVQPHHCGKTTFNREFYRTHSGVPISPSPVKDWVIGVMPRQMTEAEIKEVIGSFSQAVRRAKEAGFDGVQFHACHGDLLHQFLSPHTNLRTDKWGGSFENCFRIIREIYDRTRTLVGDDYPLTIKINAQDYQDGGITIDLSKRHAEKLNAIGIDAIEISAGIHGEREFNMARGDIPKDSMFVTGRDTEYGRRQLRKFFAAQKDEIKFKENYLLPFAREIKKVIDIPLVLPGGMRTVHVMEETINNGDADFIGLCRPLIRDPWFPEKVRKGFVKRSDCLNCNECMGTKAVQCNQKLFRPPHF